MNTDSEERLIIELQVHQYPKPYGKESILKIKDLKEEDFGIYNCSANNGLGYDNRGTLLKKRNFLDWLGEMIGDFALEQGF